MAFSEEDHDPASSGSPEESNRLLSEEPVPSSEPDVSPKLDKLILYFMFIHFLLGSCEIMIIAPLIKLFEESLCLNYYGFPSGGIEESLCKIPEVQKPLATIRGFKAMFDTIPVILITIPIGKLGDRYGRRKIMAAAVIGVAVSLLEVFAVCAYPQTFDLRLVWLSSIMLFCGGGLNGAVAFMWAMASESIPTARRSHGFYYVYSAFNIAELVSSFLASIFMDINPWLPLWTAFGCLILCLLLLWLMPQPAKRIQPEGVNLRDSIKPAGSLRQALSHRNIRLIIPVFLVGVFRFTTLNILIQYASLRFGMKISTGATFYTEAAIVNIALFMFIVPQATAYLRKAYELRPQIMDLALVRTSVILMCGGSLAIALAPSKVLLPLGVFIFSSGFGSRVLGISLISYWTDDKSKAAIYASIPVIENIGHAVADPSMQQIFAASLSLSPFWYALPFFVGAGFYGLAVLSSSFLRIEETKEDYD